MTLTAAPLVLAAGEQVHTTSTWEYLAYLVAAVLFILALRGLSSPRTARTGNGLGALGAALAVVTVFLAYKPSGMRLVLILLMIAIGSAIAVPVSRRVKMTAMPQLVALFNGVGGGAAALVALLELPNATSSFGKFAALFTVVVGGISFGGSAITFAKLQELMTTRPVVLPGGQYLFGASVVAVLGLAVWAFGDDTNRTLAAWLVAAVALAVGVLFVLPVGGADVPIVISLLNAFTGLTVAASGYLLNNLVLLVGGTLVGASGTILTRLMAAAMGRPLTGTLFGAFTQTAGGPAATGGPARPVRSGSPEDVAIMVGYAGRVVVVPGYGLAVAQAQHVLRELGELLESRGTEVVYAIHPVAGRMPGHMNVLLAEANVSYEALQESERVNPTLKDTDVALVVGANDVVNPAARTDKSAPIYGMPIVEVDAAKQVVFMKRSMRPGFAGIENELLYAPNTTLLFGDAKETLTKLVAAVKNL